MLYDDENLFNIIKDRNARLSFQFFIICLDYASALRNSICRWWFNSAEYGAVTLLKNSLILTMLTTFLYSCSNPSL